MTTINRLKELMSAATPGPWEATERHGYHEILGPRGRADWYGRKGVWAVAYADTDRDEDEQEANAALIVEAVNALPDILATIARLESERAADDDMRNVGEALMEAIRDYAPSAFMRGWSPCDCPSEIVGDLLLALEEMEARALAAESKNAEAIANANAAALRARSASNGE